MMAPRTPPTDGHDRLGSCQLGRIGPGSDRRPHGGASADSRTVHSDRCTKRTQVRRRAFIAGVTASLPAIAGCAGVSGLASKPLARVQTDLSYRSLEQTYVEGQPTIDSAPAAEAWLATDPEWIETNVRWEHLTDAERTSLRRLQRNFDPERNFFTAVVGALPSEYGLGKYRDERFDDRTMHVYAKATKTSVGGGTDPDPGEPAYAYDYTFLLWDLRDGAKPPTELDFDFRAGEVTTSDRR